MSEQKIYRFEGPDGKVYRFSRSGPEPLPSNEAMRIGREASTPSMMRQGWNSLMRIDDDVSTEPFDEYAFRADYSRMDTDEERKAFLNKRLGVGGAGRDKYGNVIITPKGQKALGRTPLEKPMYLDEPAVSLGDIADMRGDAPAAAAGVVTGALTSGMGLLPAVGYAALAGGAAKTLDETGDYLRGDNLQSLSEVATDIGIDSLQSGLGEGIGRGVYRMGKYALEPNRYKMKTGAEETLRDLNRYEYLKPDGETEPLNITPPASSMVEAPLLSAFTRMSEYIFGDKQRQEQIEKLARFGRSSLSNVAERIPDQQLGEQIVKEWSAARQSVRAPADNLYKFMDSGAGAIENLDTTAIRDVAKDILRRLPKAKRQTDEDEFTTLADEVFGKSNFSLRPDEPLPPKKPVIGEKELGELTRLANLDTSSAQQIQLLRTFINNSADEGFLTSIGSAERAKIRDAATKILEGFPGVKEADAQYKLLMAPFNNKLVNQMGRKNERAIAPEQFVEKVTRGTIRGSEWDQVTARLSPNTVRQLQRTALDKLVSNSIEIDEVTKIPVINAGKLSDAIKKIEDGLVGKVYPEETIKQLDVLARGVGLVQGKNERRSGMLKAAAMALAPLEYLPELARIRVMKTAMESPMGLRWLTVGLTQPTTKMGKIAIEKLRAFSIAATRVYGQWQASVSSNTDLEAE